MSFVGLYLLLPPPYPSFIILQNSMSCLHSDFSSCLLDASKRAMRDSVGISEMLRRAKNRHMSGSFDALS